MIICYGSSVVFSSRRRHTRCALVTGVQTCALPISSTDGMTAESYPFGHEFLASEATSLINEMRGTNLVVCDVTSKLPGRSSGSERLSAYSAARRFGRDRKSVVSGKGVSVRVDRGGRGIIKKKQKRSPSVLKS